MKKIKSYENIPLSNNDMKNMIYQVKDKFADILDILGFDLNDVNLKKTPYRFAKCMVTELLAGCYSKPPRITLFPNNYDCDKLITLCNIDISSVCSHHMLPFFGKCHIGYIPDKNIIGLSKLARIAEWFAKRPQTQEELTSQIINFIIKVLKPKGIIVHIVCTHTCMTIRGVHKSFDSKMTTTESYGIINSCYRDEFMKIVESTREL